jgi:hypothetical protein
MRGSYYVLVSFIAWFSLGCLEAPEGASAAGAGTLIASLEPEAALDAAPTVLRVRIRSTTAEALPPPESFVFASGELGKSQLSQLARDEISQALEERLVPLLGWNDGDSVVLAPMVQLEAGALYTVACGKPRFSQPIVVASDDPLPVLGLAWPPEGRGSGARPAVWCGDRALAPGVFDVTLAPHHAGAKLEVGAVAGIGRRCLGLAAAGELAPDQAVLAPPLVAAPESDMRLEPIGLRADAEPETIAALSCEAPSIALGPGCITVFDDRLLLTSPGAPLLWALAAPGVDDARAAMPDEPLWFSGFEPDTSFTLAVATVDRSGTVARHDLTLTTLAPMAHLVLNEVLANPLGEEPAQEWIEIVNDGLVAAELEGYVLSDVGGEQVLPAATLAPGAHALLVGEDYAGDSEHDVHPARGTLVVKLAELGKNGLSNEGEALKLTGPDGRVVSRFPATPKPKAGHSVVRLIPRSPDGWQPSFARSATATPGAANVVADEPEG